MMSTDEVAARLGVKAATVYAYVSRGLLTSQRNGDGKGSLFDPAEVEAFAVTRRGASPASAPAIHTGITLIRDGRLFYRGRDVVELARSRSYEAVATLLWTGELGHVPLVAPAETVALATAVTAPLPSSARLTDRLRVIVAAAAAADPLRFDTTPAAVTATARALIATMVAALPLRDGHEQGPSAAPDRNDQSRRTVALGVQIPGSAGDAAPGVRGTGSARTVESAGGGVAPGVRRTSSDGTVESAAGSVAPGVHVIGSAGRVTPDVRSSRRYEALEAGAGSGRFGGVVASGADGGRPSGAVAPGGGSGRSGGSVAPGVWTADQRPESLESLLVEGGLAAALWPRLTDVRPSAPGLAALNAALVLLADHDIAASTLAARVAASTRAHPYAVVGAGLAALDGPLHGAASGLAYEFLTAAIRDRDPVRTLSDRLRVDGVIAGFRHGLYPDGDPRATALLELLREAPPGPAHDVVDELVSAMRRHSEVAPNIDFGIAALSLLYGMTPDAGEAIFAIARTAGWIAHALEEYSDRPSRFRPNGLYDGPGPVKPVG